MKTKISKGITEIQDWMLLSWFYKEMLCRISSWVKRRTWTIWRWRTSRRNEMPAPTHQSLRCHIAMCCASDNPCLIKQSLFLWLVLVYGIWTCQADNKSHSKFSVTTTTSQKIMEIVRNNCDSTKFMSICFFWKLFLYSMIPHGIIYTACSPLNKHNDHVMITYRYSLRFSQSKEHNNHKLPKSPQNSKEHTRIYSILFLDTLLLQA